MNEANLEQKKERPVKWWQAVYGGCYIRHENGIFTVFGRHKFTSLESAKKFIDTPIHLKPSAK